MLVDMQDFFLKRIPAEKRKELILNQAAVIQLCARKKIPVIVLEYEGTGRGKTVSSLTEETQRVKPNFLIRKPHNSGFRNTNLNEILKRLGTKDIVLMGINGSGCVQDTAMGAVGRGYRIATARGVIASSSERDNNLSTSKKWYSKTGKFFETPDALLTYMERS